MDRMIKLFKLAEKQARCEKMKKIWSDKAIEVQEKYIYKRNWK